LGVQKRLKPRYISVQGLRILLLRMADELLASISRRWRASNLQSVQWDSNGPNTGKSMTEDPLEQETLGGSDPQRAHYRLEVSQHAGKLKNALI
jgi:hypothetical protein